MSDSDPEKKPSIPPWQHKPASESANEAPATAPAPAPEESRETVVAQARKFLEEDEVRDASTDKKISFLESKGLQNEEIQLLLGVARNPEASTPSPEHPQPPEPSPHQTSPLPPRQLIHSASSMPSPPPIITYPEFLMSPTQPAPLITKPRLLTTLYLFSGLTALLYGTHEYLLTPMQASLTKARLSLAETSKTNLEKLITQLESVVSEIPPHAKNAAVGIAEEDLDSDEDPTELFHRDIGVQTSPPRSRPSSPAPDSTPLSTQFSSLTTIKTSLQDYITTSGAEDHETAEVEGSIAIFRSYLEGLAYVPPSYGYGGGYGGYGSVGREEDDEIGRVKREIRGVKGVLLSARSFPGGGGARVGS
ncbi:hypothetical protein LZ554_005964 [Drepanopeziza brunnea f. sp. 'monogermtubi']|nr:hypothetical protein LZ554_005964 [Drepanopeziza brunnea f. sp. 'monogermtubi']